MDYKIGNIVLCAFAGICVSFLLICILIHLSAIVAAFFEERDYIKMEMHRSNDKEEYKHWKSELKCLYIGAIPIVRKIVLNKRNHER